MLWKKDDLELEIGRLYKELENETEYGRFLLNWQIERLEHLYYDCYGRA